MKETVLSKLENVRELPTLSVVIEKLREVMKDPNADAQHVSEVLEDDPAISVRLLKLVNSVYYGVHDPITSLSQAVACLGQQEVYHVALTAAVLDVFPVRASSAFDRKQFWMHCICTGAAACVVSSRSQICHDKFSPDQLHLAGVLHDIEKMVYEMYFHHELMDVVRLSEESCQPMNEVEHSLLHTDHAEDCLIRLEACLGI